ncbi:MAG: hypothetical protein NG740_00615 [Omnitrophica bacterium]|nr:hypothetical protein [Candidatus Omnitrophota bacterium]
MKKFYGLFFILAFTFTAQTVCAESSKEYRTYEKSALKTYRRGKENISVKPGMELRKIGGINLLIPEGAKVYEQGGQYFIESTEEFAARRLKEMESRLEAMENKVTGLSGEIENLKSEIAAQTESAETDEAASETTEENEYDGWPEERALEQGKEESASGISVY